MLNYSQSSWWCDKLGWREIRLARVLCVILTRKSNRRTCAYFYPSPSFLLRVYTRTQQKDFLPPNKRPSYIHKMVNETHQRHCGPRIIRPFEFDSPHFFSLPFVVSLWGPLSCLPPVCFYNMYIATPIGIAERSNTERGRNWAAAAAAESLHLFVRHCVCI